MNSARLLKIIFVILLLVTAGELAYYVYIQFNLKKETSQNITDLTRTPINIPTLALQEPTSKKSIDEVIFSGSVPDSDLAVDKESIKAVLLKDLVKTDRDVLVSSFVTNQYKGEIIKLSTKGGVANNLVYKLELIIQGAKIKKGFLYNDHDLNVMKITKIVDGKESPINIDELKVGDKINISEIIDLTQSCIDDKCIKEIKIVKV